MTEVVESIIRFIRMDHPFLSVVVPAFNEEPRLGETLAVCREFFSSWGRPAEVIVVDDGSEDDTARIAAEAPGVRLLKNQVNRGKGHSVRKGMLAAQGEWILFMDADSSTPIEDIEKLLAFSSTHDVIIGSRAMPDSNVEVRQNILRETMGKIFNVMVQVLVFPGIRDTQCGFKLFSRAAARAIFELARSDGFAFDVEALLLARRLAFKVREVPVTWRNSPASRVHPIRDSARMFWDILKIRKMHGGLSARRPTTPRKRKHP